MTVSMGRLVLVVDPDDSLRALFRDLFLLEGYAVDVQSEFRAGSLRESLPSAVVYGLGFGDETAHVAALRAMLEDRPPECATVVCTADPAQITAYHAELTSLGIPIVSKPFDIDDLLGIIQDGIARSPRVEGRLNGLDALDGSAGRENGRK